MAVGPASSAGVLLGASDPEIEAHLQAVGELLRTTIQLVVRTKTGKTSEMLFHA